MNRANRLADQRQRRRRSFALVILLPLAIGSVVVAAWRFGLFGGDDGAPPRTGSNPLAGERRNDGQPTETPTPIPTTSPTPGPINTEFEGLTTFRGNATRSYYGQGPVPTDPKILWRFPESGGLCHESTDDEGTRLWCGTGWTGQPNVVEPEHGPTQVRFGAYSAAVHILNARNGKPLYEPFQTGDIIKGTVSSDPDGYPLLYTGSRDNYYRVLALDRGDRPVELWSLHADSAPNPTWNDDWDSSGLVIDDYLLEGGENSWFYVVKLNRDYDQRGKVTVDPEIRMMVPGYDQELFSSIGDDMVSIENSVAFDEGRGVVYFANSGGLVQGWDISRVLDGGRKHERVFRFWTGDDTDASIVIDDEGFLYVASELERFTSRSEELGSLFKLDPTKQRNPVVWSIDVSEIGHEGAGGLFSTPGLWGDALIATSNAGEIFAVDRETGKKAWSTAC